MEFANIIWQITAVLLGIAYASKSETNGKQGSLSCDEMQRCLNRESRGCWKKFYNDGRKKEDLVGDVLKACPENEFMDLVDRTEAELWSDFNQVDKNLTECMTKAGYKIYVDFCGNMRSANYSRLMENSKPEGHNNNADQQKSKDDADRCWITALNTCVHQHPPPNDEVNKALSQCEDDRKIAEDEERLGFEVGKRVMLKIVTKLKEAFDKEDIDGDGGAVSNHTHKSTSTPHPHTKPHN